MNKFSLQSEIARTLWDFLDSQKEDKTIRQRDGEKIKINTSAHLEAVHTIMKLFGETPLKF